MVALGSSNIVLGRLSKWDEYLDRVAKYNKNDWVKLLRAALDIYKGKLKGLAEVPEEEEIREGVLKVYLKGVLKESISRIIAKIAESQQLAEDYVEDEAMQEEIQKAEVRAYEENNKAIRVAIEFCIYIDAIFFLFTDLISLFTDENLEHIFLENLQPFILSGKFRRYVMPEEILKKIIAHYKAREDFEMLEKVIMYLHITDPMINSELQHIC